MVDFHKLMVKVLINLTTEELKDTCISAGVDYHLMLSYLADMQEEYGL